MGKTAFPERFGAGLSRRPAAATSAHSEPYGMTLLGTPRFGSKGIGVTVGLNDG
jgi:hypothetical protein